MNGHNLQTFLTTTNKKPVSRAMRDESGPGLGWRLYGRLENLAKKGHKRHCCPFQEFAVF